MSVDGVDGVDGGGGGASTFEEQDDAITYARA